MMKIWTAINSRLLYNFGPTSGPFKVGDRIIVTKEDGQTSYGLYSVGCIGTIMGIRPGSWKRGHQALYTRFESGKYRPTSDDSWYVDSGSCELY